MKLQRAFFVVVALVFVVSFASVVSGSTKVRGLAQVGSATSPVIDKLMLINADTDQPIAELTSGYVINTATLGTTHFNIEAKTSPAVVGSVGFKLDALAVRTENNPPYAYAGDNGAGNYNSFTMTSGSHSLTVNAYTLSNRTGTQGPTRTVNFTVTDGSVSSTPTTSAPVETSQQEMAVTSLVLVNSDTNQDLITITDGATIYLDELGTDKLSLRAETTALPALPGSVKFKVNGSNYSTENLWPFTIPAGVADDDYRPWSYNLDQNYEITATPYTNSGGGGTAGISKTVNFNIIANASSPAGGSHASVVTAPPIPCMSATLTYGVGNGSQGPAQINAWWDPVPGVTNYRVWRQVNNYDDIVVQDSTTGTAYYTTNLSPSTIYIRVAALVFDEASHAWIEGPKSMISVVVGSSGTTSNYTTCTPSSGETTSLSLTTPLSNTNIISNANFTVTAVGAPTSDQISSVKFYYRNELGSNILLGSDSSGPTFSLTNANLGGDRGAVCPSIYAEATLLNGTRIKTTRQYIIVTDTTATGTVASCPNNGEPDVEFALTSPSQGGTYTAGVPFAVTASITGSAPQKIIFYHFGGNVAQNLAAGLPPYTITQIGTRTSAPYTLNYTVATPGNMGGPQLTDSIKAIAYYANGWAKVTNVPFKVLPAAAQPQVSSLSVMKADGSVSTGTMTSSMNINVGTQQSGIGAGFSIKANTAGTPLPAPASVLFSLSGPSGFTAYSRCDTGVPFSLFGDNGTTYTSWTTPYILGGYTITATPYLSSNCTGTSGTGINMMFTLVNLDDTTPPTNPGTITTTYRSANEIRISWVASSDPQTGIASYTVTRVGGPSASVAGTQTTYTDNQPGLTAGGAVSYSVTAVNGVGQSSGSAQAPAQSLSTTFTSGANVQTTASTYAKVAPDGANSLPQHTTGNLGTISGTSIYYNGANYWNVLFATVPPNGWVNQTALQLQQTADTQAPNQVTGLTVTNPTSSTLYVDWAPTTDNGGGSVVSYQIWRSTTQNGTYTQVAGSPVAASQTDFTDTGLSSSQTYWYKILAADNATPTANVTAIGSAMTASNTTGSQPPQTGAFPPTVSSGSTTCNAGSMPANTTDTGGTSGSGVIAAQSVLLGSSYNTTNANDPTITICWAGFSGRTTNAGKIERRETNTGALSSSSWTQLASNLNLSTSGSYTDNTVDANKLYEYRVSSGSTSSISSYIVGYIATGIEVPMSAYNGEIVLVFANDIATGTDGSAPTGFGSTGLNTQINQLIADLQGDKWTVDYAYVTKHMTGSDTPSTVRAKILARSGSNTKAVYLVGNVPIPMIGDVNPDGHASRVYSSDMIYSDTNETWSNTGCTLTWSPQWAQIDNPSSTYKFCKTSATPELQVGRIDMFDMPGYGDEKTLLEGYLSRMHDMKVAQFVAPENAYFENDLDTWGNSYKVNRDIWNDITSIVGPVTGSNVTIEPTNPASYNSAASTPMTQGTNYGFVHHGSSAGSCNFRMDVGVITPLAPGGWTLASTASIPGSSTGWTGVFNISGMSYMGEFGCENNLLRGMLAKGRGANSMYSLRRFIYWHTMGMGKTIGSSYFDTTAGNASNNTNALYQPYSWSDNGYNINGTTSLMGDPTMRLSYVKMPTNFSVTNVGGQPSMTWTAPSGTTVDGYLVYKITASDIQRVSGLIAGTSWTENTTFASGTKYMVTAVKKKNSLGGGVYWNESIGGLFTTTGGGGGDTQAPTAPPNFQSSNIQPTSVTLTWSASTGNPVGEAITYKVMRSTSTNGTYTQVGSTVTAAPFTVTDSGLTSGATYYYRVVASDLAGNTATSPSATTGLLVTLLDNQAPDAPAGLGATTSTQTSITLNWNDSSGHPTGETVLYKVFRNSGGATAVNTTTPVATGLTTSDAVIGSLTAGTTYKFQVAAYDNANNQSAIVPASPNEFTYATAATPTAPLAPTAAEESGATSGSFSANWSASATATGYRLDVSTSSTFASFLSGYNNLDVGNVTTYPVSGLAASSTYYYRVRAYNAVGTSGNSATITATTTASSGGGVGQVLGLSNVYAGPNNSEDVTPGANPVGAVDFYVDCVAGDDAKAGTSAATAWKTLGKFNTDGANQMQPGSRAFFKRGCTFYKTDTYPMPSDQAGILSVTRSGTASNYIEYKAYGTGNAPVFSGAYPVTGWTQHSGNIYKANIGTNKNIRYLFANNADQTIARTPNKATDGSTVYMRTDSITGNTNATLSVTDSSTTDGSLPNSSTTSLVGGEYAARFLNWSYVVAPISAHSGQGITVSFPSGTNLPCYYPDCGTSVYPKAGWGYFVQNKLALLDTAGEWYYDNASGMLYFWAPGGVNPNTMTVEAAVHRNGVKLYGNIHHVKIKNLVFEKFNKFTYGGSDKGAAIFIQDWTGASGSISNIIENVEIRKAPIAVRVESDVSSASNGNKILNSYIHDIFDIGIVSYGIGHLYQGNVMENVALVPEWFGDTEEWNHGYAVVSTGGNSDTISNIIRNIGYIGVNYVANGEVRGNLVENVSLTINDGCGLCLDGAMNDLVAKRNVVNHAFGNTVGLPPTFIHNTPLGSGISTGDRNSIGGIFEENVINDFGNSGMTFDNNMLSDNMTMRNNTIYTAQQGNERGARGISMYDQSVGVYHPGENNSVAGFDYQFNHKIYGNKVYTLHPKNISLSEVTINGNNGTVADYGDYWGNYFFHPYTRSSIMLDRRSIQFKTGDYVWAKDATVPVYTSATGSTTVTGSPVAQYTKGYISGNESNYRWFVTFNGSAPDGWVDSWRMEQALRTPAEFDLIGGYPPSGQPANSGPNYSTTNMPTLYVNMTGVPSTANIGSGKCGSNGQPLANPYPLNAFADAIVPEICSEQQ